jgi:putative AdoMet-dependent methyltransferase
MRSKFADSFNHDEDADGYDQDVTNDSDPIREGYAEALKWLGAEVFPASHVLDLGTGTGNTIAVLPVDCHVVAVDVSRKMLALAGKKLGAWSVQFVQSDILEVFDNQRLPEFDAIVSSYAIHHLIDQEKEYLFSQIRAFLRPDGKAVFVDLMYQNPAERERLIDKFRGSSPAVVDAFQEEFLWNIELAIQQLGGCGFQTRLRQFSDLSWGIVAEPLKRQPRATSPLE